MACGLCLMIALVLAACEPTSANIPEVPEPVMQPEKSVSSPVKVGSMKALGHYYDSIGFNLSVNPDILHAVPRLHFTRVPKNWGKEPSIPLRKSVFFRTMITMALDVNEEIQEERCRLQNLPKHGSMPADDQQWLEGMMKKYRVSPKKGPYPPAKMAELRIRMDIIPPSLTLVQAAIESAWGSSRFAREGNALFGQWTSKGRGIKAQRSDTWLAAFDTPRASVAAYCLNLNTHPSYSIFRVARANMRRECRPLNGAELAMHLEKYSAKGVAYTSLVENMILRHGLEVADQAKLADEPQTVVRLLDQPPPSS